MQEKIRRNRSMKKLFAMVITMMLLFGMTACGGGSGSESSEETTQVATESTAETTGEESGEETAGDENAQSGSDTLVVYFSATGTTKGVAEKIAEITGADTYEIKAAKEYTEADLNWNDDNSRSTQEQNDPKARPEIGSDPVDLKSYKTIYIGFPIWWGEEPRIMDTFVESHDFDGITMIPFCTSGGSGIGNSGKNLEENAGSGTWLEGERLGSSASEDEISAWIDGLK